jgi:2,4-dienoyl-CoA reductase-like NADH-dependent reductase (Old Yellow Enzyme family)
MADQALAEGRIDLVSGNTRTACRPPIGLQKTQAGEDESIRRCIGCNPLASTTVTGRADMIPSILLFEKKLSGQ